MINKMNKWSLIPLSLLLAFTLAQCEKEEESSEPDLKTATVKGKMTADLNDTIPGDTSAPKGTKVTLWISTEDLVTKSSPSKTYEKRYYQATANSDGEFSVQVDVNKDPVTVNIEPSDFEYDKVLNTNGDKQRTVYTAPNQTVTVTPEQTKIVDIAY
jgi:hypothetical protein